MRGMPVFRLRVAAKPETCKYKIRNVDSSPPLLLLLILGIETSCDETSAAIVEDGRVVRSCIIASSSNDFTGSGGVIPEQAAREQLKSILPVIERCLATANVAHHDLDAIAVTNGPGLLGSLFIGTTTARALALAWNKPLIPVHHTLGHLSSTWLVEGDRGPGTGDRNFRESQKRATGNKLPTTRHPLPTLSFPILTLSVSGGHTELWHRQSHTDNRLVGATRDDAAGEAFDKGASLLGLPYPGGPALAALATNGDPDSHDFPQPLKKEKTTDFSFSGLKTSLKYLLRDLADAGTPITGPRRADIAASYERAICQHLLSRLNVVLDQFPNVKEIHIVGGVAANTTLRTMAQKLADEHNLVIRFPTTIRYCTDNGAMIAAAGTFLMQEQPSIANKSFTTAASMKLILTLSRMPRIECRQERAEDDGEET